MDSPDWEMDGININIDNTSGDENDLQITNPKKDENIEQKSQG